MILLINPDLEMVLTFVLAIILPLLVGLVTKRETRAGVRAVLLALLSAVAGLGTELVTALQTDTPYNLAVGLLTWIGMFVVATATHFGLWKPTGAADLAQAVGGATHRAGTP